MSGAVPPQIGPYTITREIGRGGMGVVFEGRDERLDRSVAIKSLPEHFSNDPERLARFEREAKLLASLSHPNLASVFGLEEQDDARYLVMEFIEGRALSELLSQGPLAFDEALRIAAQVAAGVECAHEAGVIHRDLKPANIVVTPSGQAKVLDFGLAREIEGRSSSMNLTEQVTASMGYETVRQTGAGQIMGTAAYLSPEQARGKRLDKRTDVWSFGCVLYEMLTGLSPYAGETMTDSLGAILHMEPAWDRLPTELPATVVHLLKRMLAKDPDRRLRDLGDARIEIVETLRNPDSTRFMSVGTVEELKERRKPRPMAGWVVSALLLAVAGFASWSAWMGPSPEIPDPVRLQVELGAVASDGETVTRLGDSPGAQFAISPDGRTLAFVAQKGDTSEQLFVRGLDRFEATPLSGTEEAEYPFFSPDGQWIGFFAEGSLKKVSVTGGSPISLCDVGSASRGASWGDDGRIVFAPGTTQPLMVVSEAGGEPVELTELLDGERSHRWPHVLPGSEVLLFTSQRSGSTFDEGTIEAFVIETRERVVLHRGGSNPAFSESGHLVFGRDATLFASRMDVDSLTLLTTPSPVINGITTNSSNGGVDYAFSRTGVFLYMAGEREQLSHTLQWATREGVTSDLDPTERSSNAHSLSPDGTKIVYQLFNEEGSDFDIWVYEIERSVLSRLSFSELDDMNPIWSPDGEYIVYSEIREARPNLVRKRADGSTEAEAFGASDTSQFASDWSDDGRYIIFHEIHSDTEWDLYYLDLEGETPVRQVFLATEHNEQQGDLSPDGRWLAYDSNETGGREVYIRPFPDGDGRWQVSTGGGIQPRWSDDGSELFYVSHVGLRAAPIEILDDRVRVGNSELLFEYDPMSSFFSGQYDVSSDGQRFTILDTSMYASRQIDDTLSVVFNWFTDLERKLERAR